MSTLGQERLLKPMRGLEPNNALVMHADSELARYLPVLDTTLSDRDYLCGSYSIADIFVGCGFEGAERRGVDLRRYASLVQWRDRLTARPAWAD